MGYSNVFRAMGFVPTKPLGKENAGVVPRPVIAIRQASGGGNASLDIAIGDAYGLDANGNAFRAGPNDAVRGIVIGFRFIAISTVMGGNGPISQDYSPNGTVSTILGIEDSTTEFMVQSDSFAATQIGLKVNLTDAAPDSTLAQSRQSITTAAAGTQFQCQDITQNFANNAYGTNAQIVVRMLETFQS